MLDLSHIPRPEFRAAMVSVTVGLVLLVIKFTAYWLTGSSAIFSDAVESIVNVAASLVAFWALALAHQPADKKHPYGHGKVEFMSAGLEGGMILLASVFIFVRTIDVLLFREIETTTIDLGLMLIILAMLINGIVGGMLIRVGKRQKSLALQADGHHLLADAITSIAVVIALGIVKWTGFLLADPIVAILISLYIAWMGLRLLKHSFGGLMDEQDQNDDRELTAILDSHVAGSDPAICGYHKLRHRHSGRYHWVDFHISVPAELDVAEGHRIASAIEYEMEQHLGQGNATAHIEPCLSSVCPRCAKTGLKNLSPG
ncbi:MAG: transporter [Phycisphaerae bacterium]|jgi:cation diffusion facilitator family transporter|nr:MAG: transporter [Phycisphaerae bacterium]